MRWKISFLNILLLISFFTGCSTDNQEFFEAENYFSSSYAEARRKFIGVSLGSGAHIESLENPNKGPSGELLYTDIALFESEKAKNILVLISGTHGVEGFAGSGIQIGLLEEGIISELPPDTSLLMIHALNPYGFSHIRRFDENNIDPNRNFVDHSEDPRENKGYEVLKDSISPESVSFFTNIKSLFRLMGYGLKNRSMSKLKVAISRGQYTDPDGLFYGGRFKGWVHNTIEYITQKYLFQAERVIVLDFHTGLGDYGSCEIITNEKENSEVYIRAKKIWGNKVKTTYSEDSVSIHIASSLKLALPSMLSNKVEVTVVSPEFGTLSPLKVFWALRSENWLHHHGSKDHPKAKKIKSRLLQAFYPDDSDWKVSVWKQGRDIVKEALSSLDIKN
ncbi:hypothetical protein PM10SUCC1_26450 [Propionigenium maris DSM 9537]|uniref:DUF2817 domain-containing protein n=1 Tax=Propionigenium maris DSM 9537 TaxID=1123000 RepID=A0A9W6GNQ6_9FUSO|nr:M14 family metallopeptidase [Propionigenium maris]GLI57131.1 hypothetical protein PM10SUCC1_26450 [Propionigenium maris DSM 9537]